MHECAAGRSCRDPVIDTETGRREPARIKQQRGLCRPCERAVRQAIRDLVKDYDALGAAAGDRIAKGQLVVSLTPDPAIPLNASVLALQFELAEWAEAAMLLVHESLGVEVKLRQKLRGYPVRNYAVIEQAQRVLTPNLDLLLDADAKPVRVWRSSGTCWDTKELDGMTVALKIQRAHSKVKGVLGEANPRRRLTMPCPVIDCGMPTLGINNGETDVTCTSCGGRWSEAEYEWFAGMVVGGVGEKEVNMLRWLLAEKAWELSCSERLLAEAERIIVKQSEKLSRISKLANLGDELKGYDAWTLAVLVQEILA